MLEHPELIDAPAPRKKIYGSTPDRCLETMSSAKALISSDMYNTIIETTF